MIENSLKVTLNEVTHVYTVGDKRADMSVTQFISQFHGPFDPEAVLDKIGITDVIVRAEKKREWSVSAPEGTFVHNVLEAYVNKEYSEQSLLSAGYPVVPLQIASGIQAIELLKTQLGDGWEWHAEWRSYFTTRDGKVVAGTMDLLIVNHKTKEIVVVDHKTSRSLTKDAYGNKFLEPIPKTPASKFHKYSMQAEIYGYMALQALPGYTIKNKLLLQLKPDGEIKWHQCKDMSKEFELIR